MNCATELLRRRFLYPICLLLAMQECIAQNTDSLVSTLSTVEVKAYGKLRKLRDVPAAVGFVDRQTLERFSSGSLVMAVSTVPGVRMEERSPGSYRFNIRGSSLRAPFGVRNVKVYYNDIPFTDPGGQTFLNGLGYYNFGSMEILKGPGSSLYGAGTGGVLLIESMAAGEQPGAMAEYTTGSFGLRNVYASLATGNAEHLNRVGFQHQVSEGYRFHSALQRDVLTWTGQHRLSENQSLKTTFLYSHHWYETPGALTKSEFERDPRLSRPAAGGFPSAEGARAAVTQKTFLAGVNYTQQLNAAFSNQSVAYGAFTELRNPAIRNFGRSTEPHVGGRTAFNYKKNFAGADLLLSVGGEWQQGFTNSTVFKNKGGNADSLQTEDEIRVRQSFLFLQSNLTVGGWELTAGASLNGSLLRFRRAFPTPLPEMRRTLSDQLTPRVAISRRLSNATIYASVSKGFSPPSSSELLPSGSAINLTLDAENGTNYDVGARGTLFSHLTYDINAFYFRLKNTIVQRRDAGGGEFFINAGRTAQKGVESSLTYSLFFRNPFLRSANFWLNHTYHDFRYREFKQLSNDFSGKALPGVAPHTVAGGLDLSSRKGLTLTLTYYQSSRIALNDANTDYASPYRLLGTRLSFSPVWQRGASLRLSLGADNLLDQRFSLGNDINAFGGRYFNAATRRNYYVMLSLRLSGKKENPPLPEGL
jgi:iron complex outermembrane receptor protein